MSYSGYSSSILASDNPEFHFGKIFERFLLDEILIRYNINSIDYLLKVKFV